MNWTVEVYSASESAVLALSSLLYSKSGPTVSFAVLAFFVKFLAFFEMTGDITNMITLSRYVKRIQRFTLVDAQ